MTTSSFLISDAWMHCFVGTRETRVRWAYDPTADRLVAQAANGPGWETLHPRELADLREGLTDNDAFTRPTDFEEITSTATWPAWAEEDRCFS